MDKQHVKGAVKDVVGKVQEKAGELTGSEKTQHCLAILYEVSAPSRRSGGRSGLFSQASRSKVCWNTARKSITASTSSLLRVCLTTGESGSVCSQYASLRIAEPDPPPSALDAKA